MSDPSAMLLKSNLKMLRLPTMLAEYAKLSREAAEAFYNADWFAKAEATFGARPTVTYYETYVTVDNVKGETIVREE